MLKEATEAGFYHSEGWNKDYPEIQILTVEEILNGKQPDLPPSIATFKQATKVAADDKSQRRLVVEKERENGSILRKCNRW